jgi:hypothetical protein
MSCCIDMVERMELCSESSSISDDTVSTAGWFGITSDGLLRECGVGGLPSCVPKVSKDGDTKAGLDLVDLVSKFSGLFLLAGVESDKTDLLVILVRPKKDKPDFGVQKIGQIMQKTLRTRYQRVKNCKDARFSRLITVSSFLGLGGLDGLSEINRNPQMTGRNLKRLRNLENTQSEPKMTRQNLK